MLRGIYRDGEVCIGSDGYYRWIDIVDNQDVNLVSHLGWACNPQDLENKLTSTCGKFRPLYNRLCSTGKGEGYSYWLSPNMFSRDCYNFPMDTTRIHLVIFCNDLTVNISQVSKKGDELFNEYLKSFLAALKNKELFVD